MKKIISALLLLIIAVMFIFIAYKHGDLNKIKALSAPIINPPLQNIFHSEIITLNTYSASFLNTEKNCSSIVTEEFGAAPHAVNQ